MPQSVPVRGWPGRGVHNNEYGGTRRDSTDPSSDTQFTVASTPPTDTDVL